MGSVVYSNHKLQPVWRILHDEDRPCSQVSTRNQAMKVDERKSIPHRETKAPIVPVIRIGPPRSGTGEVRPIQTSRYRGCLATS